MSFRYETRSKRDALAVGIGRLVGTASRLWGQRGLGTIYLHLGRLPVLRSASCSVEIEPEARFHTRTFEPYWAPTVIGRRPYEPEVRFIIERLAPLDPVFVDCGANFGYWSIVASAPAVGMSRVLAIEANSTTFAHLQRNASLNNDRYRTLHAAVAATTGTWVHVTEAHRHAAAHVTSDGEGMPVATITIDDAIARLGWAAAKHVLMKLDVEGHELLAVDGAERTRTRDHAIIFEDWPATRYRTMREILRRGYIIFHISRDGGVLQLANPAQAAETAQAEGRSRRPQNLLAVRPEGEMAHLILTGQLSDSQ